MSVRIGIPHHATQLEFLEGVSTEGADRRQEFVPGDCVGGQFADVQRETPECGRVLGQEGEEGGLGEGDVG